MEIIVIRDELWLMRGIMHYYGGNKIMEIIVFMEDNGVKDLDLLIYW